MPNAEIGALRRGGSASAVKQFAKPRHIHSWLRTVTCKVEISLIVA
jgi:hypothetical protein